mmetsp:Transcript_55083/g.98272  ORF Transcript_55083/g.98272 Transcript_55083/m.98272 type:complete len:252 (+) Transcript_55083:39-794(+)
MHCTGHLFTSGSSLIYRRCSRCCSCKDALGLNEAVNFCLSLLSAGGEVVCHPLAILFQSCFGGLLGLLLILCIRLVTFKVSDLVLGFAQDLVCGDFACLFGVKDFIQSLLVSFILFLILSVVLLTSLDFIPHVVEDHVQETHEALGGRLLPFVICIIEACVRCFHVLGCRLFRFRFQRQRLSFRWGEYQQAHVHLVLPGEFFDGSGGFLQQSQGCFVISQSLHRCVVLRFPFHTTVLHLVLRIVHILLKLC